MNYTLAVLLAVAAIGIVIAALVELSKYFRSQTILSIRQLILRLVMAALLLAIIGLGFWAKIYLSRSPDPLMTIVFGLGGVAMIVAVMILALLDLRQVRATQHCAQAKLYQRMAEMRQELAELTEAKQSEDGTEQPSKSQS